MTKTEAATKFRAALVQMRSGRTVDANVEEARRLIREAARAGAEYVQTPECTTLMEIESAKLFAATLPEDGNPALAAFVDLAREFGLWLHLGSMAIKLRPDKIANRAYLIAPTGQITARYDKIHMFDVDLPGGETYRESKNYEPGTRAVVADLPWGPLGIAICYDLRFPQLFRAQAKAGACFLSVPAAFTRVTGEAHWHTLLRARAIEAQCFVFAAAQGGRHEHGRETYGHSLIISPWGQILAEGGTDPGVIVADIDLDALKDARARVPSLLHDRAFDIARGAAAVEA
ncbi:MAG: carbon-nitrogen hydrolase family protein [Hyphomicrobium sp.]|nr:carbon-nitrogen hydrolase family protein [Hyphomicrobium sp.]